MILPYYFIAQIHGNEIAAAKIVYIVFVQFAFSLLEFPKMSI